MKPTQVIIIGGGLAGCVSAIHLARKGIHAQLIEKKTFPFHKFCGEYLSKEVIPYMQSLGFDLLRSGAKEITEFSLSSHTGKYAKAKLPLGGLGIRRYSLDHQLIQLAQQLGVQVTEGAEVQNIQFENGIHTVICKDKQAFQAPIVIGAFGKRSILDKTLKRDFFKQASTYMGVKYYLEYDFPPGLVSLHNFEGGYCGMTRMEDDSLNVCYLTQKEILTAHGGIAELEENILAQNPYLKQVFSQGKKLLDKPIVISNISFEPKELIQNHVLMSGDAAGMIFPLAGNGMAMSIHAAKLLSELIDAFFYQNMSRKELEMTYEKRWKQTFSARLAWGRRFQPFMGNNYLSAFAVNGLRLMPPLLPAIIKRTHGKPLHAIT